MLIQWLMHGEVLIRDLGFRNGMLAFAHIQKASGQNIYDDVGPRSDKIDRTSQLGKKHGQSDDQTGCKQVNILRCFNLLTYRTYWSCVHTVFLCEELPQKFCVCSLVLYDRSDEVTDKD